MAFIQVELDAIGKAHCAATFIGKPGPQILGGLVLLWEYCWREKLTTIDVDHLEGHFGADGRRVARGLVAFGFLEPAEGDRFRVLGAGRYLRVQELLSEAGKRGAAKRWSMDRPSRPYPKNVGGPHGGGHSVGIAPLMGEGMASDGPSSEQRSARSLEDLRTEALKVRTEQLPPTPLFGSPIGDPPPPQSKPENKKPPPKPSRQQQALTWLTETRATKTDTSEKPLKPAQANAILGPMLDELGGPAFKAAYRAYLADAAGASKSPPWPLQFFVSEWRRYHRAVVAVSAAPSESVSVADADPYRAAK